MPQLDDAAGVRTYYEDHGQGEPIVLLHGGLESGAFWGDAARALAAKHRVLVPDRRGHGGTPDTDGPYTYPGMAEETIAFLEQVVGEPAHLVGYSDGGIVSLHVAIDRSDLVRSIVLIGSNFHVDGLRPEFVERLRHLEPEAERLSGMREAYVAASPDGPDHWPVFLAKVAELGSTGPILTPDEVGLIDRPVLVVAGDDDVVEHDHTAALFEALTDGQLAIVPGTSHLLPYEKPAELLVLIEQFLYGEPPRRMMPMRTVPAPA